MELPVFAYYADPLADGTIAPSGDTCSVCGQARGYISNTVLYSAAPDSEGPFCPWCIADGSAAARFDGEFNEVEPGAAPEAEEVVARRTPGFETWQDWEWPVHCRDVAVYLGQPRGADLPPDAVEALRALEFPVEYLDAAGPGHSLCVYLFRCRSCGAHLARWDAD